MKKESRVNKKALILPLILLSLIVINVIVVAAQTDTSMDCSGDLGFFKRWQCSATNELDAKITVLLITTAIIYIIFVSMDLGGGISAILALPMGFVLTAFVTPQSVLGIIRSYNTLPLTIMIILPTLVLFALTYLSVYKGKRVLMAMQLIFWWIYFLLNAAKLLVFYFGETWELPKYVIDAIINIPPAGTETYVWFVIGLWGVLVISEIMSLANGFILRFAAKQIMGVDDAVVNETLHDIGEGAKVLKNIGRTAAGKKP